MRLQRKSGVRTRGYEGGLRGEQGVRQVGIDVQGRIVRELGVTRTPIAGKSVVLTIDVEAQQRAFDALAWGVKAAGNREGVVTIVNPQNGETIAMASLPTYDNNLFSSGITTAPYQKYLNNKIAPPPNPEVGLPLPPGTPSKIVNSSPVPENPVGGVYACGY